MNASLPMKSMRSHKKCSQVEISNLNKFCSIQCIALKLGTNEEDLELILLTSFQQTVQNMYQTLLAAFFLALFSFVFFLSDDGITDMLIIPSSPCISFVFNVFFLNFRCAERT